MEELFNINNMRMGMALNAAIQAYEEGEVPVGAVIFHGDKLIAKAWNQRESLNDPTAHAEILAITQAAATLESWRLENCSMYVTLEPCAMCAGAIILARIPKVFFGAKDPKAGACGSVLDVTGCSQLNHKPEVISGLREEDCSNILKDFFLERRQNKKRENTERTKND